MKEVVKLFFFLNLCYKKKIVYFTELCFDVILSNKKFFLGKKKIN